MKDNSNGLTKRPTLGVVAISYNEQEDMPSFIDHLHPWVDEIIIVDDGSTDQTQAIAEKWGKVKFITSPRKNGEYFSHQRNKGIELAKSDWLLHMDIDERVTPQLSREILKSIVAKEYDAFRFRRLNFFLQRPMLGGGWQDWNLVHLAKKDLFKFAGMYHEECIVNTSTERIGQLKHQMWHLNDSSYLERMGKSNLYCQEQASVFMEKGFSVKWWHFFWLPFKEFLKKMFYKQGYRDKTVGLLFSLHSSVAVFKACALVWDQQNTISRAELEDRFRKLT